MMRQLICLIPFLFSTTLCFSKNVVEIGVASNFSELSTVSFNPFGGYFKDAINMAVLDNKHYLDAQNLDIKLIDFDYGVVELNVLKEVKKAASSKVIGGVAPVKPAHLASTG